MLILKKRGNFHYLMINNPIGYYVFSVILRIVNT